VQLSADAPSPDWYSTHAAPFCARTFAIDMEPARQRFLRHVRAGGRILDVGCGSGRDSLRFHGLGYEVDARDRSPAIAEEARRRTGLAVRVEDVLEMQDDAAFDGVWASAMLIHLEDAEFHEAVRRLARAPRPGGALYISLKQDERDSAGDGRVFRFWTMDEALAAIFDGRTPLERVEEWVSVDEGARGTRWVNVIGRRAVEPVS
jgi:2-polyprenyl-3-methyl-5-hydroxy-6-metoxy-1,4-benzoquinol methylase